MCAVAACGGGAGDGIPDAAPAPDAYVGPSAALFEVPRGGQAPPSGFYALPFPNDLRVGDDGRMDLDDYVRPNALVGMYIDTFAELQRGFGINGAVHLRFTHPIDERSLPADPDVARAEDASVYLVNVHAGSPRYGERIPLSFRFEHFAGETIGGDWLAVLPYPGFPLQELATHAVVVTSRLRAPDGTPVARPPDADAVFAATAPADPDLARAQMVYAPLLAWLDEPGGDERGDVVSAAVFTTQDCSSMMDDLRAAVWQEPAPRALNIEWMTTTEDFALYQGTYRAPNFQTGAPPYSKPEDGGVIVLDETTGLPVVQRYETMRFSMSVPLGPLPPGGWPVVLYQHGTGGDYLSYRRNGTAALLARQGIAVIGTDQVLHGPRSPNTSEEISFFNFQNPLSARDSTRQGATDNFVLLRLALGMAYTERHPGGRTIRFDPERIYFMGHSQGGLTGPPFLAHEPLVKAAVLSGAGSLLYLSLLHKTEPVDIPGLVGAFIRDYPLDEFNPVLALIQMWIDPTDSACHGPKLVREPLPGIGAKHIFMSEGFTDRYTPNPSIEAFATVMALDQIEPVLARVPGLELRGARVLAAPVTGNAGGVTAALLQYDEAPGSDGHFVVFDIPAAETQFAEFLGSHARTGVATVVAP